MRPCRPAAPALLLVTLLSLASACNDPVVPLTDGPGPSHDGGAADARLADQPRPDSPGPMANVYRRNPVEDNQQTTQVLLKELDDPKGLLHGKFANVWNCVDEAGGEKLSVDLGGMTVSGSLCVRKQKASPGSDGSYLHIKPPASDTDGGNSFAEIMMYHHMTALGDHYLKTFGLTHVARPLRAFVNVQGFLDMLQRWIGLPNAAYIPKESGDFIKQLTGIDLLQGEDGIGFGYNNVVPSLGMVNFSFDATVIYHEYTHFAVGGSRLQGAAPDQYGIDPTPFALNEAMADYFACSFIGSPKEGSYALGSLARDLTRKFKCPDHILGEEHNDGEIASGALWAARELATSKVLDQAIWKAAISFTQTTTYEQAARAILGEIKAADPTLEEPIRKIFADHGMLECDRLVAYQDFDASVGGVPLGIDGKGSHVGVFPDGVPGPIQHRVSVLDTTQEIVIEYSAQSSNPLGSLLGGGATAAIVAVALRKGSDPITYDYSSSKAVSTAQKVLQGTQQGTDFRLVLSGSCVSKGDLVFQLLNEDSGPAQVTKLKVTQSPTVTSTPNFDGC